MKRSTRLIIFILMLTVLVIGWFYLRGKLTENMQEQLRVRYPMDTFEVSDVRLSILPPGATAKVHASKEDIDFDVQFVKAFRSEEEDQIVDNYYEVKTINHYEQALVVELEGLADHVLAYKIEPIAIGEHSLNVQSGYYPIALHFLFDEEIQDKSDFIDAVSNLTAAFLANPLEGVDGYYFTSLPGAVQLTDLTNIGYNPSWLTEPVPSPTPSPTPRPTTAGTLDETTMTTEELTSESQEEAQDRPPAFAYTLGLLAEDLGVTEAVIQNGMRAIAFSERDLIDLANAFDLSRKYRDFIGDAKDMQLADQELTDVSINTTSTTSLAND